MTRRLPSERPKMETLKIAALATWQKKKFRSLRAGLRHWAYWTRKGVHERLRRNRRLPSMSGSQVLVPDHAEAEPGTLAHKVILRRNNRRPTWFDPIKPRSGPAQ